MRIAIVEDEERIAEQIKGYVNRFAQSQNDYYEVEHYFDGLDFLQVFNGQFDIVLMDIEMKHSNGMEIAQRIRKVDGNVVIMFITNISRYAINGYLVGAVDYVLKPINYDSFSFRFRRAVNYAMKSKTDKLNIISDRKVITLHVSDIKYLEVINHRVCIHTVNGDVDFWGALSEIEERLPKDKFTRCNNCYLVNLSFVKGVEKDSVFVGDAELKISRNRKKAFLTALTEYI